MSETELFTELTNLVDVDPYALLGVSVSADEKRIAKRYRQVAKQLHPDALTSLPTGQGMAPNMAAQVIARIVNPSYQKLKQEKNRQETVATLRFRVRRLLRTEKLTPTFQSARQLGQTPDEGVDTFYEQALTQLAACQFKTLQELHAHSLEIGQLNLVFLMRKLDNGLIRAKRTGLMANVVTPTAASSGPATGATVNPSEPTGTPTGADAAPTIDYVKQHAVRAKTYLSKQSYEMAVQELREALKIAPQNPELHSMIGQAYYKQKLSGMAKAHFRQALKLKPTHKVARKYGKLLGLSEEVGDRQPTADSPPKDSQKPWLGRLLQR